MLRVSLSVLSARAMTIENKSTERNVNKNQENPDMQMSNYANEPVTVPLAASLSSNSQLADE